MPRTLRLRAPAKVNLYLEVLGKRPDGYHDLRMLMAPVSLFDDLTLDRLAEPGRIEVESEGSPHVESGERNLCFRAARYFFDETGASGGVRVRVVKRVPVGAGLGGGSSDAAVTILGLEVLFGLPLTAEAKARAAFRVGADVPFFFARSAAWVEGIGEVVRPLEAFGPLWLVLVHPGVFLSTAAVYSCISGSTAEVRRLDGIGRPGAAGRLHVDGWQPLQPVKSGGTSGIVVGNGVEPTGDRPARPDRPVLPAQTVDFGATKGLTSPPRVHTIPPFPFQEFVEGLRNDLQEPAVSLEPVVGEVLEALRSQGAAGVLMSGSGSAGFGLFSDECGARAAALRLARLPEAAGWRVEVARTLTPGSFPFVSSKADWGVDKR